jgi:hypothetical protein
LKKLMFQESMKSQKLISLRMKKEVLIILSMGNQNTKQQKEVRVNSTKVRAKVKRVQARIIDLALKLIRAIDSKLLVLESMIWSF